MRGQLLVTLTDNYGLGADYLNIYINSVLRKRIYDLSNGLYSCPLYVGDTLTLEFIDPTPEIISYLNLVRKDYTTDDVAGNNGITNTSIANGIPLTTETFTITTSANAYDFEYIMTNDNVVQYQILTENFEPLLTESDAYINQQY
jgi:hypothetical protein